MGSSANRISPPRRAPRRSRPPAPRDKKRRASVPPPLSPFSRIPLISVGSVWGTREGTSWVPSNRFFLFSVFLCDFRVFRVMIRSSKRIPYTKSKYIQRIPLGQIQFSSPGGKRKTTADVLEGFAPRGLALGEGRGAKNDCGCTRRLRPGGARVSGVTTSHSHKFPSKNWSQTFSLLG